MLGRAVMPAGGNVAADRFTDRFRPLLAYVSFVRIRHQRQPISPRLATGLHADAIGAVSRCCRKITIGIGPAVDRVVDHPVDGGVVGTPPRWSCTDQAIVRNGVTNVQARQEPELDRLLSQRERAGNDGWDAIRGHGGERHEHVVKLVGPQGRPTGQAWHLLWLPL